MCWPFSVLNVLRDQRDVCVHFILSVVAESDSGMTEHSPGARNDDEDAASAAAKYRLD